MKNTNKFINDKIRAIICAAIIFGLMAGLAFRQTNLATVSAQTAENEIPASPESIVQIFSNTTPITINDNSTATPYPSSITVSGEPPTITQVRVQLTGFSHTFPDDVDVILVGPQGQRSILMSDAGGSPDANGFNLFFDQNSANILPDAGPLVSDTYRPANYENAADTFPAPGPGALTSEPADLSVFNLTNPNGTWSLYVVDDQRGDSGQISGGWSLVLTVPTVFTVNSTNDPGSGVCDATECTLREAIAAANAANGGDLINFSTLFNTPQTINLLTALPDITKSVTIQGTGANLLTVRRDFNAATDFRIFNIAFGVTNGVAISGMTIAGGRAPGNFGGGILSQSNLTLTNVHVTGNQANSSGGVSLVFADGVFTGCTFSGNTATSFGGGIKYQGDGGHTLRVVSSTVSGNSATNGGGGIDNLSASGNSNSRLEVVSSTIANNTGGGILTGTQNGASNTATTTLRNTIIAANTPNNLATGTSGGGAATFQTLGFNLSNDYTGGGFTPLATDKTTASPQFAPLAFYGGQTPTHALLAGSTAIDGGQSSGATSDQRGRIRPFGIANAPGGDGADIGAVEMQQLFLVINTNDAGAGSLRDAVTNAPPNTDILFDPLVFNVARTITLTSGELVINKNLNIIGTGANLLTVSGNNNSRVFSINSGFTASLSGMTISGGNGAGATSSGNGGGILNAGNLTISDSVINNNTGSNGGGIASSFGTFNLNRSTVSGNTATFGGGGLNLQTGNSTLTNSTISGNTASSGSGAGGGVLFISFGGSFTLQATNCTIANNNLTGTFNTGGGILTFGQGATASATTLLRNTIIANNALPNLRAANSGGGAAAAIISQGFNLASDNGGGFLVGTGDKINANPLLGSLTNNGGTTPTHALLLGSPALDAGNNSGSGALTDQRGTGFNRTVDLPSINNAAGGDGTDIGAFEVQAIAYEGDIQNRPNGDGFVDAVDIQQIRQFVVGNNLPYQSNEFQRADCSPRSTGGDGFVDGSDVQQARRYSLSLDSQQLAGGPTAAPPIAPPLTFENGALSQIIAKAVVITADGVAAAPAAFRVDNQNTSAGATLTVPIRVDTVGNEAGYTFSIAYDSTKLTSPTVAIGNGGGDVIFNTNNPGQIGFSVTSFAGGTITAGNNVALVNVTFAVAAGASSGTTPITFTDTPARRKASGVDPNNPITQPTFTGGTITIGGATAADALVSGRVLTADGRGIGNVRLILTGTGTGEIFYARSGVFGYYRFEGVPVGQSYILTFSAKRFTFNSNTVYISLVGDLTEKDFIGTENFQVNQENK